jgi:hypothetical protein
LWKPAWLVSKLPYKSPSESHRPRQDIVSNPSTIRCSSRLNTWISFFFLCTRMTPQQTTTSSVALFADDTKCYLAISKAQDVKDLQCDFDRINKSCQVWCMSLNQSKCNVVFSQWQEMWIQPTCAIHVYEPHYIKH